MSVVELHRTLDQELLALARQASLECLVCGEFVLHVQGAIACPECRSILADGGAIPDVQLPAIARDAG